MSLDEPDDNTTGFNVQKQKLHCLVVLNDTIGKALSNKAGEAFFRAFVVEDRETGEVWCKQRFRYVDGDSWMVMRPGPETKKLSRDGQVEYFANAVETTMRKGCSVFAGGAVPPKEVVVRYYPPNPDNGEATLEWLIAQDLMEVRQTYDKDGNEIPITKGTDTPT